MLENIQQANLRERKWYALFVCSNQERRSADRLSNRGIEHFLPCYQSIRQWKDRRVKIDVPLFPGYLFVRIPLLERARVLTLPSVVSLVGTRNCPSAISDEEIAWIMQGVEYGKAEPCQYLTEGEHVVITQGVMAGMEGILLRKHSNTRVVVSLGSIQRSFAIEVDVAWVAPLVTKEGRRESSPRFPTRAIQTEIFRPAPIFRVPGDAAALHPAVPGSSRLP